MTVFERNDYVGGRTTTVNAWDDSGRPVELGGSIFVEVNHIMVEAMKKFGLSPADRDTVAQADLPDLGVWNGYEFVLVTKSEDTWWDKAKLLWRYGAAPLWTNRLMKSAVGKFLTMYNEPVFPWKSLSEAVEQVGLLEVTGVTGDQYLKANGIGDAFAKEIIQARQVLLSTCTGSWTDRCQHPRELCLESSVHPRPRNYGMHGHQRSYADRGW